MKPQTFALFTGALVGGTGLMGMITPLRKPITKKQSGKIINSGYGNIMGAVPTNTLFNWLRMGIGTAGILASRKKESSVIFNRAIAASYAGLAVMGVIPKTNTMFGLMPIFGGNVWLHSGTALTELLSEEALLAKAKKVLPFKKNNLKGRSSGKSQMSAMHAVASHESIL